MSRHYLVLHYTSIGENVVSPEQVVARLSQSDPEFARELAKVNWQRVVQDLARKAMERVAAQTKVPLQDQFSNNDHGERGESVRAGAVCVGVLREGGHIYAQLGLLREGTTLTFLTNAHGDAVHTEKIEGWKAAVARVYAQEVTAFAMQLVTRQSVTRTELPGGTIVLESGGKR